MTACGRWNCSPASTPVGCWRNWSGGRSRTTGSTPTCGGRPSAAWAGYARGAFAEDLALIDRPAALALMKDLKDPYEYVRHHVNLAHKLAGTDPTEAEQVYATLRASGDRQHAYQADHYAAR